MVTTSMSNIGLHSFMKKNEIKVIETAVGDRYVYEAMKEHDSVLGGEQSGHVIFKEFSNTGDGLLTALQILCIIRETGKTFKELASEVVKYPQVLINLVVKEKKSVDEIPELVKEYNKMKNILKDEGRIVIRYSGTEPLLRIMIEGKNQDEINKMADDYKKIAEKYLGA
ncbi:hypothetical protein ACFL4A_04680 [bacterium]